jgi:hypothetical protein
VAVTRRTARRIALAFGSSHVPVSLVGALAPALVGRVWLGRGVPREALRAFCVADTVSAGGVAAAVLREKPVAQWLAVGIAFDLARAALSLGALRAAGPPLARPVAAASLSGAAIATALRPRVDARVR